MPKNIAANKANISQIEAKYKDWTKVEQKGRKFVYHHTTYDVVLKKEKKFTVPERIGRIILGGLGTIGTLGFILLNSDFRKLFWKEKRSVQIGIPNDSILKITSAYNNAQLTDRLNHLDNYFSLLQESDPTVSVKSITECITICPNYDEFKKVFEFIKTHPKLAENILFKNESGVTLAIKFFKGDSRWEKQCPQKELDEVIEYFGILDNLPKLNVEASLNACGKFINIKETSDDFKIRAFKLFRLILENADKNQTQENLNKAAHLILPHLKSLPETEKELLNSCHQLAIRACLRSTKEGTRPEASLDDIHQSLTYYFEHIESFKEDKETQELVAQFILGREHREPRFKVSNWVEIAQITALNVILEPENIKRILNPENKQGILTLNLDDRFKLLEKHFEKMAQTRAKDVSNFINAYLEFKKKTPQDCVTAINLIVNKEHFFESDAKSSAAKRFLSLIKNQGSDYALSKDTFAFFGDFFFNNTDNFTVDEMLQASLYFIRSKHTAPNIAIQANTYILEHPDAKVPVEDLIRGSIFTFGYRDSSNAMLEEKCLVVATKICLKNIPSDSKVQEHRDLLQISLNYFFDNFKSFENENEAKELFALHVLAKKIRPPSWVNRSIAIAGNFIHDPDVDEDIFIQNRDRKLLFLEGWLPRLMIAESTAIRAFLDRCLTSGLSYPNIDRVICLIAKNKERFDMKMLCKAAKIQIRLFNKMKGIEANRDIINFYGSLIYNLPTNLIEIEIFLASNHFVSWKHTDEQTRIHAVKYLINDAKPRIPSEALTKALSIAFRNPKHFGRKTLFSATNFCLKNIPQNTKNAKQQKIFNQSLAYLFDHFPDFKNETETKEIAALNVLSNRYHKDDWTGKSIHIACKRIHEPDNDDATFIKNRAKKLTFAEACLTQLMVRVPQDTTLFLERCMKTEDEFQLKTVACILSQFNPVNRLTTEAIEIANRLILSSENNESADMIKLANAIQKYPEGMFPADVIEKANNINFFADDSKIRIMRSPHAGDMYAIAISTALVKKSPETVLRKFYENCFLGDPRIKGFVFQQLKDDSLLPVREVIDAGGVSRSFLSDLFWSLKDQAESGKSKLLTFNKTKDGALPIASPNTIEGRYRRVFPSKLSEQELREAVNIAFASEEKAPNRLKDDNDNLNLDKVREYFDIVTRHFNALTKDEENLYETIGKIMAMCLSSGNRFVIGQIFHPAVYNVICAIPKDELAQPYQKLSDKALLWMYEVLSQSTSSVDIRFSYLKINEDDKFTRQLASEIIAQAYPDYDDPSKPEAFQGDPSVETVRENLAVIQEAIRSKLLDYAKQDSTLAAIFCMARGMAIHLAPEDQWSGLPDVNAASLQNSIQGVFSPRMLKDSIVCSNISTKDHFNTWIDEHSTDQSFAKLKDFLYTATGSRTLAVGSQITLEFTLDSVGACPVSHTCSRSMDFFPYPTYEIFKDRLETSIANSLASGFQRM